MFVSYVPSPIPSLFPLEVIETNVCMIEGSRPVGQCTCERATSENQAVTGAACPCGLRSEYSCTCEKAEKVEEAIETDFTTKQ